jgi:signal transduction histidine kinase
MQVKSHNYRAMFWRCYRPLVAFVVLAVLLPAALIIPAHHERLQEQALAGATQTIEAASLTIAQAFAGGKQADVEQEIITLRQAQAGIGLAFVSGWTGKIVAHSDRRQVGTLFVDFVPPPEITSTRTRRRNDGSAVAEVTVPLRINGAARGAFRAEIDLPAVDRQALHMALLFAALGAVLLALGVLVARQMARSLDSPYANSLERLTANRTKALQAQAAAMESKETWSRTMLDNSPMAMIVVDERSGEVRYVNQAFCRLWGCEDIAARLRHGAVGYEKISKRTRALAGDAAFTSQHDGRPEVEHRALTEDELSLTDGRTLRRFSARVGDERDGYVGRLFIFEDVTAYKRAEADISVARDAALAASQSKSEFLATMSHELRTAMNPLLGMTELLRGTALDNEQAQYTDSIRQSAGGLLAVISDILDFSKIEAGQLELELGDFDLHDLVEGVVDKGDPARLRQVLLNLIGNAIKFTERGEVVLAVHSVPASGRAAIRIASDGSKNVRTNGRAGGNDLVTVRFEVKDTGIGIDPERQAQLFEPQSLRDGAPHEGGSGLGLVIAKQLVGMMSGDVGVESTPGRGSLFWFTAVLHAEHAPAAEAAAPAFNGSRLLVVDDNATARALLERQLDQWRIPHDSAASGGEGLKRLRVAADRGTPYTLALVDLEMPSMDGSEMSRIVSQDPQLGGLRMVLLAPPGSPQPEEEPESPVTGIVSKPVGAARLYEALVSALA